ncbi:MAG: hypothetical protein NTU83_00005, partial [Candidatus Hydrogenedentes bacterium]|nr:hypothetical protein [Candidatus Hydrogenedentota bacterium]
KNGGDITIAVSNAQDLAGNTIASPNSGTHTGGGIGVVPTVSAVAVQTGLAVGVTYSEAMGVGVTTASNYAVSGTGQGTLSANPTSVALVSGNTYRLTWAAGEMKNGGDITIAVGNAQDLAGNAIGSPSSGTHTNGAIGVAPTASITLDDPTPTGANVVHFSVDFNESVGTSFTDSGDVTVTGTLSGTPVVSGSDPHYNVAVTLANPDANGTVGISVGTTVTDLAGNPY